MQILIIEDDADVAAFIQKALEEAGHLCDRASDGEAGLALGLSGRHDVLVVDRMLPKRDGLSLVRALRHENGRAGVLMLTALSDVDQRVEGLKAGADDYLGKPFAASELLARVEALGRRRDQEAPLTRLVVGDLELDLLARTVKRGGEKIDLQPREFSLLEFLMRNAGHVVTRTMLLEKVWEYHFDPQTNVIDVHISRLRSKIDRDFDAPMLHTVRGAGYRLQA
ncbi:MAG TPA: DNA-binding response regulator [Hyphomonadaceae bacterium]|nr:DNA-binding response regulator [Hyphomonadaceae bacterium]